MLVYQRVKHQNTIVSCRCSSFSPSSLDFLDVLKLLQDPARALARPGMGGAEEGEALGGSQGLDSTWIPGNRHGKSPQNHGEL